MRVMPPSGQKYPPALSLDASSCSLSINVARVDSGEMIYAG